jgi:hypothetical protein
MDCARCKCPHESTGNKCGRNPACPIHGDCGADPAVLYALSYQDRQLLLRLRIAPTDSSDDIQQVRQADEDRFKP